MVLLHRRALPAWFRDEMSLSQAMNIWWANNGQLRLTLFAAIALAMVGWMWTEQGHYTAHRRKPGGTKRAR
ncbi:hypothetical protein Y695_04180 [Hydrogenophaga sp. T4]|nr:hypothetical protein Y695_04180 [Hydrogenophaga sp. T4]